MKRLRVSVGILVVFLLAWAGVASAQNVSTSPEGLTIHGFIDGSFFLQNQNFTFGNGQNAEFPVPPEYTTHRWFLDGDVRNTRLILGFNGPKLENDFKVGGTIEADFFGGFNGAGGFSNAQDIPRLRLAYVDLTRGRTTIRVGQFWSPLFGNVALSYSHIAFPLGYGAAGDVGWRFPGVFIYHDLTPAGSKISTKLTLAAMRNTWSTGKDITNALNAGTASAIPQLEARLDWGAKNWGMYAVGHYDRKDLTGTNEGGAHQTLNAWAAEFGAKVTSGPVMLQGNIYTGKAIGQSFGQIAQFGNIKSWGAWVQGGYNFTPRWSGYIFAGYDKPNKNDVLASGNTRTENLMLVPSLMYNLGPYGFNIEWLHDQLKTGAADVKTKGDQIAASMIYKF